VAATETDIDRYEAGSPLDVREGTLLAEPDGGFSIITGGVRRPFDTGVFAALGYSASAALTVTAEQLSDLTSGPAWSDITRHPAGTLVKAPDGSKWTIGSGDRNRVKSDVLWKSRYRDAELVSAAAGDLALPVGSDQTYRDGTRFKLPDGSFWIYAAGSKRRFVDSVLYYGMGYTAIPVFAISYTEAGTIPNGLVIG